MKSGSGGQYWQVECTNCIQLFPVQSTWEDANGEPVGMAAQQLMRSLPGHMIRALEVAQAEATAANDLAQVPAALRHALAACFDEQSGAACHCPQPLGQVLSLPQAMPGFPLADAAAAPSRAAVTW